MAGIARLAWRNLGRNRRRTTITALALAVGTSLSVAAFGMMDGMAAAFLDALTGLDLGHVQVHHPDYPQRRRMRDAVPDVDRVLARVEQVDGVVAASPRLYGYALVAHRDRSLGVELVGVDPRLEPRVTSLHDELTGGSYLDPEPTPWPRGRELTAGELARDRQITMQAEQEALAEIDALLEEDDGGAEAPGPAAVTDPTEAGELALVQAPRPERPPRVILGAALTKVLGLEVGARIHATGQAVDGTTEQIELEVAGIYQTGTARFDRSRVYMNIADLQRFTRLYGKAHEVSIVADSPDDAEALADRVRGAIDGDQLLVRPWQEIRPDIKQMLDLSRVSTGVMIFIILFVATLGVVNTMLMAVFERTRELGMLKAIGMSGWRIVRLIMSETLLLVLVASTIGTGIGLLIDWYMVVHGVDLRSITGGLSVGGVGLNPVFYGDITITGVVLPTVILAVTCLLASIYPAVRAARLRPAVGMRET